MAIRVNIVKGSSLQEETEMKKKDEVKKTAGKTAKISKPANSARARSANANMPAKKQKKPVEAPAKAETTLKLEAPQADQVFVAGSFNRWDPYANSMERDPDGAWSCTLVIDPGEYDYRFFVDGEWCDDPENLLRHPNGFGTENCVLIVQD